MLIKSCFPIIDDSIFIPQFQNLSSGYEFILKELTLEKPKSSVQGKHFTSNKLKILDNIGYSILAIFYGDFIEKNLYQDTDDIKQNRLKKLTNVEKIDKLNSFCDKNNFIVLSKYSKSLLEFKYINNKIIVTIKYNKLNIRNRYEQIDKYIPSDINMILHNFNILQYQELLEETINIDNIKICENLLNNDKNIKQKIT